MILYLLLCFLNNGHQVQCSRYLSDWDPFEYNLCSTSAEKQGLNPVCDYPTSSQLYDSTFNEASYSYTPEIDASLTSSDIHKFDDTAMHDSHSIQQENHDPDLDFLDNFDPDKFKDLLQLPCEYEYSHGLVANGETSNVASENILSYSAESARHPNARRFPPTQWQYSLLPEQVQMIYDRLSKDWPDDMSDDELAYHSRQVSRRLDSNPQVLKRLLENHEATWCHVTATFMPKPYKNKKEPQPKKNKKEHMITAPWLARPMKSTDRDFIVARLAKLWKLRRQKDAHIRLCRYAELFIVVTSPEPLLSSNEEEFEKAANAIYYPFAPKGYRHPRASENDMLHQYTSSNDQNNNEECSQLSFKPQTRIRARAARYHSGEEWLRGRTYEEIAEIQNAVKVHWNGKIHPRTILDCFLLLNDFLEHHREYIEKIKKGDRVATAYAARVTQSRIFYQWFKQGREAPGARP